MKRTMKLSAGAAALALAGAGMLSSPAFAEEPAKKLTKCSMDFTLKGWSAIYKTAEGEGTITCDNGQTAAVKLKSTGGGLTFGKSQVQDGYGVFTEVAGIDELYGGYAAAGAEAGAGKSAESSVVTKGDISLAFSAMGSGVSLGFSFGKFSIEKK